MTDTPDIPHNFSDYSITLRMSKNVLHPERFFCHVNKFIKRSEKLTENYRVSKLASNSPSLSRSRIFYRIFEKISPYRDIINCILLESRVTCAHHEYHELYSAPLYRSTM